MNNKIRIPDPFASNATKQSNEYGKEVAKMISGDWFDNGTISEKCNYSVRSNHIMNNRKRVRGEQDDTQYKKHAARQEGDMTYLNLDWRMMNHSGKFCNLVSNGIRDKYYRLDIRAIDKISAKLENDTLKKHRKNMRTLPLMKKAKETLGIDLIPKGFIPQDEEELTLWNELKEKTEIEIGEESTIKYIKGLSRWDNIEETKNKDLVQNGLAVARVFTDPNNGVMIKSVDIEKFGHSYVEKNDFSDATYFFEIESLTLSDIQKESRCTDAKIRELSKSFAKTTSTNADGDDLNDILNEKANVMRFTFKTNKTDTYKAHKRNGKITKVVKKDEDFDPPERSDYGKLAGVKSTWFEGAYVLNADFLYEYKECENIIRDEMDRALPPYIARATNIYKNVLHSFLDDIAPLEDQMQYIHLKIQLLIAEIKPDVNEINLDHLADLSGGGDNKQADWKMALNLLGVKGVVFTKRTDMGEMGIKDGSAIRPNPTSQGSGLAALLNSWAHYENQLRSVSGVNPARDGSAPHDALLGVSQMQELASNTITEHITRAATEFNKSVSEVISSRIHRIYSSDKANKIQKKYERALSKEIIGFMEVMEDRHLHDFGFTVEMMPSKQEMDEFKEDLMLGVQEGTIDPETKIEAQQIARNSPKLAGRYLIFKRRKKIQERREDEEHRQKLQTESNIAATTSASQNQIQAYGLKTKIDLEKEARMAQMRVMEKKAMQEIEAPVKDKEFKQDVHLEKIKSISNFDLTKFKEDAKDIRLDQQSSNQSKMIKQRQADEEPIEFGNDIFNLG